MVQNKLTKEQIVERAEDLSFPKSVIEYFQGLVGMPYGGFPEPLRTRVLKGKESLRKRAGEDLPPLDYTKLKMELFEKHGREFSEKDVMSASLYPKVFDTFEQFRKTYGPVDKLGTRVFFVGPKIAEEFPVDLERGKTLHIKTLAMSDVSSEGTREVFFELNGQLRSIVVVDKEATKDIIVHPKAIRGVPGSVGSPMPGEILEVRVKPGDQVTKGQPMATLSAMKMEMVVSAPISGKISRIHVDKGMKVNGEDLLIDIE